MKSSVLTRYRVMAYVTGVLLIALTLGVIAKYVLHIHGAGASTTAVGFAHGWLYVVYLVFAFDLSSKAKLAARQDGLGAAGRDRSDRRLLRRAPRHPRADAQGGPAGDAPRPSRPEPGRRPLTARGASRGRIDI